MVLIHDEIVLSTRRRPFRHDSDIRSIHFDRAGATIDLFPQEGLGDVQELDDPGLSTRVILPKADAQGGSPVRIRGVPFVGDRGAVKDVAADPGHSAELGDCAIRKAGFSPFPATCQ